MVAIVGRPNVGKSSLLNAAAGRRVSIVHDRPGVTRDRVEAEVEQGGRVFRLMDTGGLGMVDDQQLDEQVDMQIQAGLQVADVLLFLVDARDGVTPLDRRVAAVIRRSGLPHVIAANKVDAARHSPLVEEFHELGMGRPAEISAKQVLGITDLLDDVVDQLPAPRDGERPTRDAGPLVAVVGQRNAGKSTLLNELAGEERVIVSELPGTTRDAVDVQVEFGGRRFTAVDTAGMRKDRRLKGSVEFYGQARARAAIRRAHVVVFMIDATRDVSQVDKKIAADVEEARKPCVLAVNKWDLTGELDPRSYLEYLGSRLPQLGHAPVIFISALQGTRLGELTNLVFQLHEQAGRRVPTAELNRVVAEAAAVRGPRVTRGRYPRIYFATQVGVHPPWIVLFVNNPALFKADFRRFLENRLRRAFPFKEIPLRISFRRRRSASPRDQGARR